MAVEDFRGCLTAAFEPGGSRSAMRAPQRRSTAAALEWQVGGAWANLSGDTLAIGTLTAQQKSEQIRIAAGVTVGDQPLPLPLHIQGFPAGFPMPAAPCSTAPGPTTAPSGAWS